MNPQDYYDESDSPGRDQRVRMWRAIERSTKRERTFILAVRDPRSFLYGMAAAILLFFSGFGAYSLVEKSFQSGQPAELRFDEAYRSAIREFENVLPARAGNRHDEPGTGLTLIKQRQLGLIDAAIRELREDIARTDLSPLKRSRLRQLYSMKLKVLQEIIEQGDVEL